MQTTLEKIMKCFRESLLILAAMVLIALPPSATAQLSFSEDFTTTTYEDPVNTTADWNTADGELKLPPFVPSLIGSAWAQNRAVSVEVAGDHAYVADRNGGLRVFNISNPSNPYPVGSRDTPGSARELAIAGNLAFVADRESGLQIIDITDPTAWSLPLVGSYDTPDWAVDVAVAGDHAYLVDRTSGLLVIDITDPANPALAGSYDTPDDARGIVVSGDLAFVANMSSGLLVFDITDPTNPALVGTYDTPGDAMDIAVAGDLAFVADGSSGLQLIDISDPANPVSTGSYDTPDNAADVVVSGDRAFVADVSSGLLTIDISDPTSPTLAGTVGMPDEAWGVAVSGEHAFVGCWYSGLQVAKISDPTAPTFAGSYDTYGNAWDVVVSGDLACVASFNGLQLIDISDPTNPMSVGYYNTLGDAKGVAVAGDHAYVACNTGGLRIIDISDPFVPTEVGNYYTTGSVREVVVSGDLAFVADPDGSLVIIDISDPTNPALAGSYSTQQSANDVDVSGDCAFVAVGHTGLQAFDISDPTNPMLLGTYDTPGEALSVVVSGDIALVSASYSSLQVIDISDPTNPTMVGEYGTSGYTYDIAFSGDRALLVSTTSGLEVMDISNPANPMLVDSYDILEWPFSLAVSGEHTYVADHSGGLQVIRVYQSEGDVDSNIGQSLTIDSGGNTLMHARLTTTQTAGVTWEMSADAGANWQAATPDGTWFPVDTWGDELLWRSTHYWAGVNPTVSNLTIDWLTAFGPITSITDVPDDQGSWVRLDFVRSGYDFAEEDSLPVTGYQVYRRVDDAPLRKRIIEEGMTPTHEIVGKTLASFDPEMIRILGDRTFLIGEEQSRGEFPPGTWEIVATTYAAQQDEYSVVVPTRADSTVSGGIDWSVHFVSTHTTTPSVWFASEPDSGYSVDNIAPGAPGGFLVDHDYGSGPSLVWDENGEEDFQYYRIYRGLSEDFEIGPEALVHETAETSWHDSAGGVEHFYKITALDHAGNESDPASPDSVTDGDSAAPQAFALHQNSPNPFNPVTKIRFDLPRAGHVRLEIFEVSGRRVAMLLDESREAGRYSTNWRGRDDAGNAVSS
ncbi:MAG: hypothetical protein GY722_29790, partial [bacterium]|nr:hypothetical protein [bacterium]